MCTPESTPVILGVGEAVDRTRDFDHALEPVALMAEALKAADQDAGGGWLSKVESLELVALVSWRYVDPVGQLCESLGIDPAHKLNASMGGETPVRLIHEAAVRIARGENMICAIVGGEAQYSLNSARKARARLNWTPMASKEAAVHFPGTGIATSAVARRLQMIEPTRIYPLYEMATQAKWGQSPAEAQTASADLWASYASVAAANPSAWIRTAPDAETISTVTPDNRLINWPYPKLMVANPNVNQAAAVIVTSLAAARAAGVAEDKLIHVWGGGGANEPENYLHRDRFDHSTAQNAVLSKALDLVGGDAGRFGYMELYSCFPVVPKMALKTLGLDPKMHPPTVTGGITFFGGPLNNHMGHAACAMVRALRQDPGEIGLLYGQGGYVSKHYALVVSHLPPPQPLELDHSVQAAADAARGPSPEVIDDYAGEATIETYTIQYARGGEPIQGVVVVRTPGGARAMARVLPDDMDSLALLQSTAKNAIGTRGFIRIDSFGKPAWEVGDPPRDRRAMPKKYCIVEREGPLTIVTINRPDSMNALNPGANAELAEVFDDFAADPDQWVAILTGAGDRAFSAGNDLKHTASGLPLEVPTKGFAGLTSRFDLNKPVIAAVNGVAMGGGFEIALACDIIVASETAIFALTEPKVGLAALAGGLLRLPRQIGLKQAMGIILTGRRVGAQEGHKLGFVNEVAAPGEAIAVARRWAQDILACSPMSIRASMEVVRLGLASADIAEPSKAQSRYPAVEALFKSTDFREGPQAFAQKRAPHWRAG